MPLLLLLLSSPQTAYQVALVVLSMHGLMPVGVNSHARMH
jgi:hypothetical protein